MKKYSDNWFFNKKNIFANYRHFDHNVFLYDVIDQIDNEDYIEKHSFLPFLRVKKTTIKYNKNEGKKTKIRDINYASHFDYLIYALYSHYINRLYTNYAIKNEIDDVVIAYRDNTKNSSVECAKKAFDFIKEHPGSVVFVGDFTHFFDELDHNYLKKQLCNLLNIKELPVHLYKVLKSVSKFSYVEKEELLNEIEESGLTSDDSKIISIQELRKRRHLIKQNKDKGVAQGISFSAILSNVYMSDFDKSCKYLAKKYNGLYLRYVDDFIFVFPNKEIAETCGLFKQIKKLVIKIPNLILQEDKTKIYYCQNKSVINCDKEIGNANNSKNSIDYLGFTYDGQFVKVRDKTISKYYYRTYKKIKTINWQRLNGLPGGGSKNLYINYSLKGTKEKMNFITYINKCIDVFGYKEKVHLVLKRHYRKIKRRLINR